jgi:hypothetical protein
LLKKTTARSAALAVEPLEARDLAAATLILLDFDGVSADDLRRVTRRADSPSALTDLVRDDRGIPSFVHGVALLGSNFSRYGFLDFNLDRRLDASDGQLAATRLLKRVQEDFAPYNVAVVRQDSTARALEQMAESDEHDTYLAPSGADGTGGQALLDNRNRRDSAAAAGGARGVADWMANELTGGLRTAAEARDGFVNFLASVISHEAGHSFGLEHVLISAHPEADDRNLMDPFLYDRNMSFWDRSLSVEGGGTQNQHLYLTETLGASPDPWAAVLRPGQLTIQGDSYGNLVSVYHLGGPGSDWQVTIRWEDRWRTWHTQSYQVDPSAAPDINSLNQFKNAITLIHFVGAGGHDSLSASSIAVPVWAEGGSGNDTFTGGSGNDTFVGGDGWDVLDGGSGNDWLSGDRGNDRLDGRGGRDYLYGGDDNDALDGGHDHEEDYLHTGGGSDTVVEHQHQWLVYNPLTRRFEWTWVSEDSFADFDPLTDRKTQRRFDDTFEL